MFSGEGTFMVKEDFQFTAGDLVVFEGIWHLAPSLKKDGTEPPRTNLVI